MSELLNAPLIGVGIAGLRWFCVERCLRAADRFRALVGLEFRLVTHDTVGLVPHATDMAARGLVRRQDPEESRVRHGLRERFTLIG